MVGAYVLASELAAHGGDLQSGVVSYENALRDYVTRNQDLALAESTRAEKPLEGGGPIAGVPDFGALTLAFGLQDYSGLVTRP
jgi:hypothetical protein